MFTEVPRYIGFPNQVWIDTRFAFRNFEKMFKNKLPFFVSTYRFKDKNTPIVDNLFFDIDSYYSIRVPWRNVKLLKNWCYKHDIPYTIVMSGGKGFHFYVNIKPVIAQSNTAKDRLRDLMYSVQLAMVKYLGVEAYDEPTFGRLHFLARYPTSKYIRKDEETGELAENGFYCRYLTDEEFDAGVKKISKLIKEPGIIPKVPKSDITLQDIADLIPKFKLLKRSKKNSEVREVIQIQRNSMTVPTIDALGLPCLKEIASHSHPTHFERVELVAWLKYLGYSDIAINAFIKQLNWTRYDAVITEKQVKTIYPRMVKCSFLRQSYGYLCSECIFGKNKRR